MRKDAATTSHPVCRGRIGASAPHASSQSVVASMELLPPVLKPSRFRKPYFDGWNTSRADFEATCENCRAPMTIPFSQILAGAWGWKEAFGPAAAVAIASHFGLGDGSEALGGGWPSISQVNCGQCGAGHIFYADFDEYRNSVYRIVAQGFAAVVV